jgi:hypothetical protein
MVSICESLAIKNTDNLPFITPPLFEKTNQLMGSPRAVKSISRPAEATIGLGTIWSCIVVPVVLIGDSRYQCLQNKN